MKHALFLQSEIADPFAIYTQQQTNNPVYWDAHNGIWAVYSYAACKTILDSSSAWIPPLPVVSNAPVANLIRSQLARLSNTPQHASARETVLQLYRQLYPVNIPALIQTLLGNKTETDWVQAVCKKLPVLYLLKGLGVTDDDSAFILDNMPLLTQLMLPHDTLTQPSVINHIYEIAAKYVPPGAGMISNLIGLLIQAYDAGRGVLSNALLQLLHNKQWLHLPFPALVTEALRLDTPIHTTRRILQEDLTLENCILQKGQTVLVVLAAANRDPQQFSDSCTFNPLRANNNSYLTFGSGAHACLANHFTVFLAATALQYLFSEYKAVALTGAPITYEAVMNARLPLSIHLSLRSR